MAPTDRHKDYKKGMYCNTPNEIPTGEHWAIITGESATISGDERSHSCPGHGYPEHTECYIRYEAFTDEEAFKRELARRFEADLNSYHKRPIIGVHVDGTYGATVSINLVNNRGTMS
jgi:hypothetical protein